MSRRNRRSAINRTTPMTCIDGACACAGERIYTDDTRCPVCFGPIFPWDEVEFKDDDGVFPDVDTGDNLDAARIRSQRLFEEAQRSSSNHGLRTLRETLKVYSAPEETFTCPETLTGCPVAAKPIVNVPNNLFEQWTWLAKEFSTEWLAYLYGSEISPGTYEITGYYFPKQKVTPAHCEAEDGEILEGVIGTVHSHVGMDAFFSTEDQRHFNHPVEMVINRRADVKVNCLGKLECGRLHRSEGKVFLLGSQLVELKDDLKAKIVEERGTNWTTSTDHKPGFIPPWHDSPGNGQYRTSRDTRTPAERMKDSEQLALSVMPTSQG